MRLCTGQSCAEFALLAGLRATRRATDSLHLFESRLLGLHGCGLWGNRHKENGQFRTVNSDNLVKYRRSIDEVLSVNAGSRNSNARPVETKLRRGNGNDAKPV